MLVKDESKRKLTEISSKSFGGEKKK